MTVITDNKHRQSYNVQYAVTRRDNDDDCDDNDGGIHTFLLSQMRFVKVTLHPKSILVVNSQ